MPLKIDPLVTPSGGVSTPGLSPIAPPARSSSVAAPTVAGTADAFVRGVDRAAHTMPPSSAFAPLPPRIIRDVLERVREFHDTGTVGRFDASGDLLAMRLKNPILSAAMLLEFDRGLPNLLRDPAHGGLLCNTTMEEAAVGFMARLYGIIRGSMRRDVSGIAEFVDLKDQTWDVKSPVSPPANATWKFDAAHIIVKIRHDLLQRDRVILNLMRCTPEDAAAVLARIKAELNPSERDSVWVLLRRADLAAPQA